MKKKWKNWLLKIWVIWGECMNDVMVDIETLGIIPGSIITQIGACYFDRNSGDTGEEFLVNIDIVNSLKNGMTVNGESLNWWLKGDKEITFLDNTVKLRQALERFTNFLDKGIWRNDEGKKSMPLIWCHPSFDIPILASAYKIMNRLYTPWQYYNVRGIRTLGDLAGYKWKKEDNDDKSHDALEDCKRQVIDCVGYFMKLGLVN